MKIFNILDKMDIFNNLVTTKTTGSPEEFARRLGVSRSTLYEIIDDLRSRDLDIKYSRSFNSFYYDSNRRLEIKFTITSMSNDELRDYSGGVIDVAYSKYSSSICNAMRVEQIN